jgi:hypothetical protein
VVAAIDPSGLRSDTDAPRTGAPAGSRTTPKTLHGSTAVAKRGAVARSRRAQANGRSGVTDANLGREPLYYQR